MIEQHRNWTVGNDRDLAAVRVERILIAQYRADDRIDKRAVPLDASVWLNGQRVVGENWSVGLVGALTNRYRWRPNVFTNCNRQEGNRSVIPRQARV